MSIEQVSIGCMEKADFAQALEQQVTSLRKYAAWLTKDTEEAHDLTQETLVAAWLNRHRFVFNGSIAAWLRRILFNKYVNQHKRSKRLLSLQDVDQGVLDSMLKDIDPLEDLIGASIEQEVGKLENRYRDPIEMRIRGFKYHEIAKRLDIPEGTVKNRIFEGRRLLRQKLSNGT